MNKYRTTIVPSALLLVLLTSCGGNTQAGNQPDASTPKVVQVVAADIAYAVDEHMLVDQATLVIVGTPIGTPTEELVDQQGQSMLSNYPQTIRVVEVLKGTAPGDTLRIARVGLSSQGRAQGAVANELRGPLPPGRQVLFLMPSANPEFYEVVGHASGELPLNASGRVTGTRPEARGFENLDVPGIRKKLTELQAGHSH